MHMSTQLPSCLLSQAQHFNKFLFTQKALTRLSKKKEKQDMFVKHNAPDNGQFQRRPISQGQIF